MNYQNSRSKNLRLRYLQVYFYTLYFVPIAPIQPQPYTTLLELNEILSYNSSGQEGTLLCDTESQTTILFLAEVWPGDLNYDWKVTVLDILPIGYFYNLEGWVY
jgi:hypothetical protein